MWSRLIYQDGYINKFKENDLAGQNEESKTDHEEKTYMPYTHVSTTKTPKTKPKTFPSLGMQCALQIKLK